MAQLVECLHNMHSCGLNPGSVPHAQEQVILSTGSSVCAQGDLSILFMWVQVCWVYFAFLHGGLAI